MVDELTAAAADVVPVTHLVLGRLADKDIDEIARDRLRMPTTRRFANCCEVSAATRSGPCRCSKAWRGGRPTAWHRTACTPNCWTAYITGLQTVEPAISCPQAWLAAVWGKDASCRDGQVIWHGDNCCWPARAAREAEANGLLASGEHGVEFPHDLIREAVYADIPPVERDAGQTEAVRTSSSRR